ncbi:MAG: hypothetical protein QOF51_1742 [Chloroflexota bacterium]|nr:hypothetical protein [Chloroflexota bacterium]
MEFRIRDGPQASGDDVINWDVGIALLATRRTQSLLTEAGIPAIIAGDPRRLRVAAARYLEERRGTSTLAHWGKWVEKLLQEFFDQTTADYGRAQSEALYAWLRRHFVSKPDASTWWLWSILLPRLAGAHDNPPRIPSPLSPAAQDLLRAIVLPRFGQAARESLEAALSGASAIPLEPDERRTISLEVVRQSDEPEIDVVRAMGQAILSQRTWLSWRDLLEKLEPSEVQRLVDWARQEARAANMPSDWIELPDPH